MDSASTTFEGAGTATSQPSLSVLFSPHGLAYPSLRSYVAAHLIPAQALPLTALLHCFDAVSNPWWLGGNICAGFPAGREVATRLRARAWVSAHDGDKLMKGWGTTMLKTRRYLPGEMMALAGDGEGGSNGAGNGHVPVMDGEGKPKAERRRTQEAGAENGPRQDMTCPPASLRGTEILALGIGEEVVLTRDGVRNPSARADKVDGESGLTGQPECRTERLADLVQSSTTVTAV